MTEIVRGDDSMKYILSYNAFHNPESIGINGKAEKLIRYAYKNGNGRLKQVTYANGHTMKATYNRIGQKSCACRRRRHRRLQCIRQYARIVATISKYTEGKALLQRQTKE